MEGVQVMEKEFPRPKYQISIMHGRMRPADKDFEMQRFVKMKRRSWSLQQ